MYHFNAQHFSNWHWRSVYFQIFVGEPDQTWEGPPIKHIWLAAPWVLER